MSRLLRIKADVGDSFKCFNPVMGSDEIPLDINGNINYLEKPLSVKLTATNSLVAVDGVFRFNFGGIAFSDTDILVLTIYIYKDNSLVQWAYYTVEEINGINLQDDGYITFSIPIKFIDKPNIISTSDIANYYIGIYTIASVDPTGAAFTLQQYCVEGREIES